MIFTPDQTKILGRCLRQGDVYFLGHSGTCLEFRITGTYVRVTLDTVLAEDLPDRRVYLAVFENDLRLPVMRFAPLPGIHTYTVFQSTHPRTVTLRLLKLTESGYGNIAVLRLETDSAQVEAAPDRKRRLEFIGDSITCGYGAEQEAEDLFDTAGENAWLAYSIQTALRLEADWHIVSQSGIGIYSGFVPEDQMSANREQQMPELYPHTDLSASRLRGLPPEKWDHRAYKPDWVIVNLGTNDASYVRGCRKRTEEFLPEVERFLMEVLRRNPESHVLYVYGMMDRTLLPAIREKVEMMAKSAPHLHFFDLEVPSEHFGQVGHPDVDMHRRAAELVAQKVRQLSGWG